MAARKAAALVGSGRANLREHLVEAAAGLIARRGSAGLTVREIAAEAGVATGVLYNHVSDREELIALALHAHVRATETALGDPPPAAGEGTLADGLAAHVEHIVAFHRAVLPAFTGLAAEPGVLDRFSALAAGPLPGGTTDLRAALADYLRAERDAGWVGADADVETAAAMVVGACHDLFLPGLLGGPTAEPAPDFAARVAAAALRGLAPQG